MNISDANMFDSRNLNLRLFINALKLDKQVKDSYSTYNYATIMTYIVQCNLC